MRDVIVVGARCGGASAAMLLARKGYKVLLIDRATFPRDIAHGHLIHRDGPARLARWGILDRMTPRESPPITSFTLDIGDSPLTGRDLVIDGVAFAYAPRRLVLDKALVDAAVDAGVELREGFTVEDVITSDDRVVGIRGRDRRGGAPVTEHARVTIGADGRRSAIATAISAPSYDAYPTLTCWYFSYWSGVVTEGLEIYVTGDKVIFAFPTSDGLFGIFIAWPIDALWRVRADIETQFLRAIDSVPEFAARVNAGRREERFAGATDLPNFFRKPYGPGWALVGDAGCHKDPYMALGVCDAFRDADFLAEALDDGFSGRSDLQQALARYEQRRNEAEFPLYQRNLNGARFNPPPADFLQLRAAVRGDQEATNRCFLAQEGLIPFDAVLKVGRP
jgi:flavin-dependent dehydrogenase